MKHLVLLGAGHAHAQVLLDLAREPMPAARVTLVSPFAHLVYSGMVPGVVAGHYAAADAAIEIAPLAARAGAAFVQQAAVQFDATARSVTLGDGRVLGFDTLSIDTGAVMDRDSIPGARDHALFVRPIEHFMQLLQPLFELAARRTLSLVVVGAGAGGVELAMALQHRLGERARLSLVTGGTPPLPSYPAAVQAHALRALKRLGVTVFEDSCAAIEAGHVLLGGGARLACDALVLAIGASAPKWLAGSGLALDAQGFIATGATLQSASHAHVFAAGDVASRSDAPRPRSGVYAVRAGPPLALNLRRFMAGGELAKYVPQRRALNLLSCGERRAIASWGNRSVEGRWVWWWKDRIDRGFVRRFAAEGMAGSALRG
ncbi:MAG: FAD-dependent oxidoreductase [Burkholderiaceae bacterium]